MDDDTTTEDDTEPVEGEDHRLTAANQAAKRAKKREEATARENAFLKAGIDTDTPAGQLAMKGYDGELTKEAIAAWYAEVFPSQPVINGSEISEGEKALTADRQHLATGGDPTPPEPNAGHPHDRAMAAAREHAFNPDRAAKAWIDNVLEAAFAQGDGRVIMTPVSADGATRPMVG